MRIAFDVDGVFTDIEKYQLTRGKEYFKNIPEENLKLDEYDVEEIFNVSHKERNKFWTKYIFDYCIKEPMRKDASITLNKLHEEGHEIYIVTGRVHTLEKGFVGALFRKMLIDWLKKNNIPYEKIIYCNEKGSEVDKLEAIKNNQIDVLIDDKRENINEASKITNVLCYDALYNQDCLGKNITRVHNFNEIYHQIQILSQKTSFIKKTPEEIEDLTTEEKIEYFKNLKKYYQTLPYDDERIKKEEKTYLKCVKIGKKMFNLAFKPMVFNKEFIPSNNGYIIASNHNNYYDQFPIIAALNDDQAIHFLTATKMLALKRGNFYMKTGVIPVDRNDKNDRARANDELKKILLHDGNIGIFPEGRTNRNEDFLLEFHPGAVSTAQITGCPIVPVAVNDHYKKKDGTLCVRFGEPFYVLPTDDILEKTEYLKQTIGKLKQENIDYEKEEAKKLIK